MLLSFRMPGSILLLLRTPQARDGSVPPAFSITVDPGRPSGASSHLWCKNPTRGARACPRSKAASGSRPPTPPRPGAGSPPAGTPSSKTPAGPRTGSRRVPPHTIPRPPATETTTDDRATPFRRRDDQSGAAAPAPTAPCPVVSNG